MKRRQLKWILLALISGAVLPYLIFIDVHGKTVTMIAVVSWLIFGFSTVMFGLTKYYTIKELLTTFKSSLKFEVDDEVD
jgi:hypothetical protein